MTREQLIPTDVRQAWRAGAAAEARARDEGLNRRVRELRHWVELVGRHEPDTDVGEIAARAALIFTAGWSWRDRLRLAWRIAKR